MNRRSLALALSLTVLIGGASMAPCALHAADTTTVATPTVNKDDATFVHDALMSGMTITKTSELAITRGLVGSELAFAKQTLADHSALNDELKSLAKAKSVMIPTTLDTKAQKHYDELGKESDKDFAESYLEAQISAHKQTVSSYKDASEDAKDMDLKAFAERNLVKLQAHLDMAKELEKQH